MFYESSAVCECVCGANGLVRVLLVCAESTILVEEALAVVVVVVVVAFALARDLESAHENSQYLIGRPTRLIIEASSRAQRSGAQVD